MIHFKWFKSVELLRTIRITIFNVSTHYYNYIKCMYTLLVINNKLFESVEQLRTITITILNACTLHVIHFK